MARKTCIFLASCSGTQSGRPWTQSVGTARGGLFHLGAYAAEGIEAKRSKTQHRYYIYTSSMPLLFRVVMPKHYLRFHI